MFSAPNFILFVMFTASLWCGFVWAYGELFNWTQWLSGINLIYFPHGLRMVLAILFGFAGAVGIMLGTALMGLALIKSNLLLGLAQSFVAGFAVWAATHLVLRPAGTPILNASKAIRIESLDGKSLIVLAFASAVLNASGHTLAWYLFDAEAEQLELRFASMFTGDLLGALVLLYALRSVVLFVERKGRNQS